MIIMPRPHRAWFLLYFGVEKKLIYVLFCFLPCVDPELWIRIFKNLYSVSGYVIKKTMGKRVKVSLNLGIDINTNLRFIYKHVVKKWIPI